MERLNHPVYRNRIAQFAANALLCALAFYLAFRLRFLDTPSGIPGRYQDLLWGSIAFVALGQAALFSALGLHRNWWRYFMLRDIWPLTRAVALATAALVVIFTVAKPYPDDLPRSVVVLNFILTLLPTGGARAAVRFAVERPARRIRHRKDHDVLVVGAGSGGRMVVRE